MNNDSWFFVFSKSNDWWLFAILIVGMVGIAYLRMKRKSKVYRRLPDRDFPKQWREILEKSVPFYQKLSTASKRDFEEQIHIFLLNYKIRGHQTEVTGLDQILVASGAVIPTFKFKKWHYVNLEEVIIFPERFQVPGTDEKASGLVGWGEMKGQMWLSRKALYKGFHEDNQKNVAVHEFIHLIDMQDGVADGVIDQVMGDEEIDHWVSLMNETVKAIDGKESSIRDYAKANPVEFLAVTGEFYFENPNKMRSEHPKLFRALEKIFNPDKNWF